MNTALKQLSVLVFAIIVLLAAGCTRHISIPDVSLKNQGNKYAVDSKIDLAVNLCLTDEFKTTTLRIGGGGVDTFVFAIGDQLAKNASELSDILFRDVVITGTPVPGGTKQVDAILTPRVAMIERTYGITVFSESVFTIVIEWKMENTQHNIIWMNSIKGEGRASQSKTETQMRMLLEELFGKSLQAMKTSPEISQFVNKIRNKGDAQIIK